MPTHGSLRTSFSKPASITANICADNEKMKDKERVNMEQRKNLLTDDVFEAVAKSDFTMKIGGTVYEVSTHFSEDGKQSVLQQFRDLLLSQKLI